MDLIEPAELAEFRAEVRDWLAANVPAEPRPASPRTASGNAGCAMRACRS